jgi:hypothetical protein
MGSDDLPIERRVLEAQRLQHATPHDLFVGFTGDPFDHQTREPERGVVVRHHRTERRHLFEVRHRVHEQVERVRALAGVLEEVAVPTRRVVQEVQHGHVTRDLLVLQTKFGDVGANGRIELDATLLHELHDRGRRVRLARRPDLKQRACIHREWLGKVGDAMDRDMRLLTHGHADGNPRHVQPRGELRHLLLEFRFARHRILLPWDRVFPETLSAESHTLDP